MNKYYDIPPSFIGLGLLSLYSSCIGTAYVVSTNGKDFIYLPVWAALVGMSSSGKSLVLNKLLNPLENIQAEFDSEWEDQIKGVSDDARKRLPLRVAIYRDAHVPTLIKSVLPDNPKGILKLTDELLEWINGMNQLSKKEGTDEQVWLSSWNCNKYSAIRSGKDKVVIPRPFVNIVGGIQLTLLPRLFAKDRDTTGFIFRLLFALPDADDKIAELDPTFEIPSEWYDVYKKSAERLYKDLPVVDFNYEPRICQLKPDAIAIYQAWVKSKTLTINRMEDQREREIHSGIFGKIKEYSLRFAAILHLADQSLDPQYEADFFTAFKQREYIDSGVMMRSIKLADYFFGSAAEAYNRVQQATTAPWEVLTAAKMMARGMSYREMAKQIYGRGDDASKQKISRNIKIWIRDYPRVFNSLAK
ncbi:MAG TPA: DUF3987 domain-containing protein [Chryseosolibacter sp.]|nr:DUF3987 domain-containing protein [Chryseosolibacter sp.]